MFSHRGEKVIGLTSEVLAAPHTFTCNASLVEEVSGTGDILEYTIWRRQICTWFGKAIIFPA